MHEHHGRHHQHDHGQESAEAGTLRRLQMMLDHWIEHSDSHVDGYREWADQAGAAGEEEVAREIHLAIEASNEAREHLKRARAIVAAKLVLKR